MYKRTIVAGMMLMALSISARAATSDIASPDGKMTATFWLNPEGAPRYTLSLSGNVVLPESRLGLIRDDADFSKGLTLLGESAVESVTDKYSLPTIKRLNNSYMANRKTFHLQTAGGAKMDLIFQASNDGIAFRYLFPETSATEHSLKEEVTSFSFDKAATAWLQPIAQAKSGWSSANPSYEEYYEKGIPVGTPSTQKAGWVFPALFRTGDTWVLLSETAAGRSYCGTRLRDQSPNGEYSIGFADPRETIGTAPTNPHSALPWSTPWRLIVVGSLATITESTLGTDLADKPGAPLPNAATLPGKASWSWPLLGDGATTFDVQKRFVDYAADMGWKYCLVDALWDKQIGDAKMKDLVDYARTKNVDILAWYNSAGDWNTTPQTPRDKMLTHASRIAEFDKLRALGVKGLKIDFFGGDGQAFMNYYQDILDDAAPYGFLMNFHGATLPRGWERTYPHLMTMEAIRGLEFCAFEQANADQEPSHACMLPFTRNVFDPMDFTPVAMDKLNDKVKRRTTPAFELALSVLFTSGIQHYAETPEGLAKQPDFVKDFLKHVPAIWEDVKFLDGFPGKYVAIARKGAGEGGKWYIAAVNGEPAERTLSLDVSSLNVTRGTIISDGPNGMERRTFTVPENKKFPVLLPPAGGVAIVFE